MGHLTRAAGLAVLAASLSACVVGRQITDVVAHNDANSYKVQTLTARFFLFAAWQEWAVWNCYRTSAGFRCVETDYEQSKSGFKPTGALPPPEAPPKPARPATPAPQPDSPAVPAAPPQPAEPAAPTPAQPPADATGSRP